VLDDQAARLVTRDHSRLVPLGILTEVLMIDAANIRTTDRTASGSNENFSMTWRRDFKSEQLDRAVHQLAGIQRGLVSRYANDCHVKGHGDVDWRVLRG